MQRFLCLLFCIFCEKCVKMIAFINILYSIAFLNFSENRYLKIVKQYFECENLICFIYSISFDSKIRSLECVRAYIGYIRYFGENKRVYSYFTVLCHDCICHQLHRKRNHYFIICNQSIHLHNINQHVISNYQLTQEFLADFEGSILHLVFDNRDIALNFYTCRTPSLLTF